MQKRIVREKVDIDWFKVETFFKNRAKKLHKLNPAVAMLYQDNNPELAARRDNYEKNKLLRLLDLNLSDVVLDYGCGIGRWALELRGKVGSYTGIDSTKEFITYAREKFKKNNSITKYKFYTSRLEDQLCKQNINHHNYSLILSLGVFHYLNDDALERTLKNIIFCCNEKAKILIRVPISYNDRLTLQEVWSEDLQDEYHAIYRTRKEYLDLFSSVFFKENFYTRIDEKLYPTDLENRKETCQHIFLLERKGEKE